MIRLSLLGPLDLRAADGRQVLSVLAQPKRVALLAYLASQSGYVRRDTLLGVFWPESDEESARHALRQSLYTLRRSLGPRLLVTRGDEELAIDRDRLACDAVDFERAVQGDRPEAALELYRGDLLEGFFLSGAPAFEKWLDGRRATLRSQAAEAAWALAEGAERTGDSAEAADWARRAAGYAADDESTLHRLMTLLDRVGDRAAALRAYEAFAWRLENELGLEPSPETRAVASEIRVREAAASPGAAAPRGPGTAAVAQDRAATPDESMLAGIPATEASPGASGAAPTDAGAKPGEMEEPGKRRFRVGILVAALAAAAVIADFAEIVGWVASWFAEDDSAPASATALAESMPLDLDPRRIAVLYFEDFSEDQDLAYLANGLTEELITRLSTVPQLDVISRNGVKPYRKAGIPPDSIVRLLRPGTIVEGSVMGSGGQVRVHVQLIDAKTQSHLASRSLDAPRSEQLALVETIAVEVQEFLRQRLGEEIVLRGLRAGTDNPEAWSLVSRAQLQVDDADSLRRSGDLEGARRSYERAAATLAEAEKTDPDWHVPHIRRGWLAYSMATLGASTPVDYEEDYLQEAISHANQALRLAPGAPEALYLRGTVRVYSGWAGETSDDVGAWLAAEEDLTSAIAADPSLAGAWAELSRILRRQGRLEEADLAARRALDADAFLTQQEDILYNLAVAAMDRQELGEAMELAVRGQRRYPQESSFLFLELLFRASPGGPDPDLVRTRELESALLEAYPDVSRQIQMLVACILVRSGLADSAKAMISGSPAFGGVDQMALLYEAQAQLMMHEHEAALELIESYLEARPNRREQVADDWWWDPLRGDPRFEALIAEG